METTPATLGEFRIEAVLGQGGSGVVYDAVWGPRRVALKVLHANLVATDKERAQFLAEARRLQQIAHPAVVKVFTVGELPDRRPYLAMERLDGETLAQILLRGPVTLARAMELWTELSGAVAALHEQGLVHRDLKPENVFVVAGKHAVLLDFGIAKDLGAPASTTTQDGHVRGTPAYMAPERFFGQPAGVATDVYELALVLYAMLAGRLPWDDLADPEARLAPRSLCELAPVPAALDVEVRRALSTRAPNRPTSARALLAAVQAAASGVAGHDEDPAETARLRSAGGQESTPVPPGEQQTPLAWAPTVASQPTAKRGIRKAWLVAAGAVAAVSGGSVWLATRPNNVAAPGPTPVVVTTSTTPPVAPPKVDPSDPWYGTTPGAVEPEVKALALVEPKLTPETYRAESAAAVARLPATTRFVFSAQLAELRAQSQVAAILDTAAKKPQLAMVAALLPPCVKAMVSDAEWIVFGSGSLDTSQDGTLVMRGRWRRDDVMSCLGETKPHVAHDGAKLYRISDDFWLDFIDVHTAYVTRQTGMDADHVHELVRHGAGPSAHARELLAQLPADRSLAFVLDGKAGTEVIEKSLGLPNTTDLAGWIRLEKSGAALDIAVDPHDAAIAHDTLVRARAELGKLFGEAKETAVGKLEVVLDKTAVHVRGTMTGLMLALISSGLSAL